MSCGCGGGGGLCRINGAIVTRAEGDRLLTTKAIARYPSARMGEGLMVRWLGMNWRGVPMPIRWHIHAKRGVHPEYLPECGCIDVIKRIFTRWQRVWSDRLQ